MINDPDIWLCTTRYQCYERCPRDVKPTDVIIEIRNMAVQAGKMHPGHKKVVDLLKTTGHAVPINDQIRQQRIELGLDKLPPTVYKYKDELDNDLQKMTDNLFIFAQESEEKSSDQASSGSQENAVKAKEVPEKKKSKQNKGGN